MGGKFFAVDGERFLVKGATYGTFAPDHHGEHYPPIERAAADFAMMARFGVNTVRMYTPPSVELLDAAAREGLRVMVGIPWAQHVAFLDDSRMCRTIRHDVAATVRRLADHPAILLFALGNEIPASVVRWHGRERVQRFVRELYDDAKSAGPECSFTYVNFPPTEYLETPFVDVCAFNVYLHDEDNLRRYIRRLQHIAGNRPLLLAEAGADSIRHGETGQAQLIAMQLRAAYSEGACGAIAFAWTDEWWRGGYPVEDWAFGLVDAERRPKVALRAAADVFAGAPFGFRERATWPRASVVVCAYNAAATLEDCLSALERLDYPDVEVIVVNDGSTDATGEIAGRHPSMKLVEIPNGGLGAARNVGLAHATGEIVAYIDADARAEPDWLTYLVQPFLTSDVVACGGPNVSPADDPWLARAVALSPGGPTHVMLDDRIAEHVPGCNLAIRRDALLSIGGFNPIYLRAGDDVDVCWRLQARGGKIGFSPSALVWHHHRPSVGAYWRQQKGYGEGEAWLLPHHPDKFVGGRAIWKGAIYSELPFVRSLSRTRIDAGVWGTAAFPSVYRPGVHPATLLPHSAGWVAIAVVSAVVGLSGAALAPSSAVGAWLAVGIAGIVALLTSVARCVRCALLTDSRSLPRVPGRSVWASRLIVRLAIAWLHFVQPLARRAGWIQGRFFSPATDGGPASAGNKRWMARPSLKEVLATLTVCVGRSVEDRFWGHAWTTGETLLTQLVAGLRETRAAHHILVDDGWQLDRDISVAAGRWGWVDVRTLVEDHGSDKRLWRAFYRVRPTRFATIVAAVAAIAFLGGVVARPDLLLHLAIAGLSALCAVVIVQGWQILRITTGLRAVCQRTAESAGFAPVAVDSARHERSARHPGAVDIERPSRRSDALT